VEGLRFVKDKDKQITIGNGSTMAPTKSGDLKCEVTQFNCPKIEVILKEVKYVPELRVDLFRID
jgi:hypothetical protein